MGFSVGTLSAFTEKATELLTKSVLFSDDLARYSFQDDVQYKQYVNVANTTVVPQAGTCGLTATGGTTFTQVELTAVPVAYHMEYCFEDLVQKAIRIERQAIAKGLENAQWEEILTNEHINKIKKDVYDTLMAGATTAGDLYNGWSTIALAASDRVTLDSAYTGLTNSDVTTSNIDDIIANFCLKIVETEGLWAKVGEGEHVVIHVAPGIFNTYKQYLISSNLFRDADKNLAVKEMWVTGYEGQISIKEESALTTSGVSTKPKMFATYDSNLWIASSMIDDVTSPKAKWVVDEVTDYVYFKSAMRLGAQIAFTDLVVTNY